MKKIFAFAVAGILIAACHKTRVKLPEDEQKINTGFANGLPENASQIHGYFYLNQSHNSKAIGSSFQTVSAFACFRDPEKNIMSYWNHTEFFLMPVDQDMINAVSVGIVKTGTNTVYSSASSSYFYNANFTLADSIPIPATWSSEGNKTFKAIRTEVPRGFPTISESTLLKDTASISGGFVLHVSDAVKNSDSTIVSFSSFFSSAQVFFRLGPAAKTISLTPFQVNQLTSGGNPNATTCRIFTCNYSNMTVDSKVMVFELANSLQFFPSFKVQ